VERHWWRVLAGLVLIVVGVVLTLAQYELIVVHPDLLGMGALFLGALVFMALWLSNPKDWWPMIPGLVMLSWAVSGFLGRSGLAAWLVSLVGFAGSAVPFLLVYVRNRRRNWWALIPGGILGMMGLATTVGELVGEQWLPVFVLAGIAGAFLLVFLTNRRNWWALIPAGVLALVAVSLSPLGAYSTLVWSGLLVVAGLALVLYAILRRT
jgi:hypothetical protein